MSTIYDEETPMTFSPRIHIHVYVCLDLGLEINRNSTDRVVSWQRACIDRDSPRILRIERLIAHLVVDCFGDDCP